MRYKKQPNRRDFLKILSAAIASGSVDALLPQMRMLNHAMAANSSSGGYKALVCLELNGGNDSYNLLMPRDTNAPGSHYDTYRQSRGGVFIPGIAEAGVAIDFNDMQPIVAGTSTGNVTSGDFGLHPECMDRGTTPGLKTLFDQNRLAFVANVGPLVQPITKTQFNNETVPIPPRIASHNDQSTLWAVARTDPDWPLGWGGMLSARITPSGSDNAFLPPVISLAGQNLFQVGRTLTGNQPIIPYRLSSTRAVPIDFYAGSSAINSGRRGALNDLLELEYEETFTNEYRKTLKRANDLALTVNDLINQGAGSTAGDDGWGRINTPYQASGNFDPLNNLYPGAQVTVNGTTYSNNLLNQLRMVARLIKASCLPAAGVNAGRQIYFASLPSFDTHSEQMRADKQPLLMAQISQAVGYFAQAMQEIGTDNDVTLFTSSEFARTLSPNGDGTDHAWGGVQLVMGGAVNGGQIYGRYPNL